MRGSHEHLIEQTKQTVKAKSSCQRQQRNTNQSKASKYVRKLGGQAIWANELVKKSASEASQPSNQQSNQPTSQLTAEQLTNLPTNRGADLPN